MTEKTATSQLSALIKKAQQLPVSSVAVVDAQERHVLEGVLEACDAGLINSILISSRVVIESHPYNFDTFNSCAVKSAFN